MPPERSHGSLPWFRQHTDFADDPRIQMLGEAMQRRYVMVQCLTGKRVVPTDDDAAVAFALRLSASETKKTKRALTKAKLIDRDWKPLDWDQRHQFASDHDAAERKRRQRERERRERDGAKAGHDDVTPESRDSHPIDEMRGDTDEKRQEGEHIQSGAGAPRECDAPSNGQDAEPEGFTEFIGAYPDCARDQDRDGTLREYRSLLQRGHKAAEIVDGARRYAAQCKATHRSGTQYVASPANWLHKKRFTEAFPLPLPKMSAADQVIASWRPAPPTDAQIWDHARPLIKANRQQSKEEIARTIGIDVERLVSVLEQHATPADESSP